MKCDLAYVLQADTPSGIVKVGRSGAPLRRVASIAASVPFSVRLICVLTHGQQTERDLKKLLVESRVRGEWFQPTAVLVSELERFAAAQRIVSQVIIDREYVEANVIPRLQSYLQSKDALRPKDNAAGDLVYRILHGEPMTFVGRESELMKAVPNAFSGHELLGWCPTPQFEAINLESNVLTLAPAPTPERVG